VRSFPEKKVNLGEVFPEKKVNLGEVFPSGVQMR
jgi:hypothetical protein